MINLADDAMTIKLDYELPEYPKFEEGYRRAPRRESHLTEADKALAIKNALRYIHPDHHEQMAKEFAQELEEHGRIYGYRFRPEGKLYGKPIDEYKGKCIEGKAIQVMIDNNLDFDVALYPYELVTYGETGQMLYSYKLTFTLPTDAGILEYLLLHQGRPVSQEELLEHVWDSGADGFGNSIRVHISALRKKLRAALGYDPIRNRIGEGYVMEAQT